MSNTAKRIVLAMSLFVCLAGAHAGVEPVKPEQGKFESEINAVVRNKTFYKKGHFELGPTLGTMPFDSVVNHYLFGGRLNWHLSDHLGWEVLDAQFAVPSVTGFTTDLVSAKGISNLQTAQIKMLLGTNLLISPLYGKVRFIGNMVLYFDIYAIVGLGFAKTETLKFSATTSGGAVSRSTVKSGFDPMLNLGVGFKIFFNRVVGLVIDLRDYVPYSETYGKKSLGSNFAISAGLSFFLPPF